METKACNEKYLVNMIEKGGVEFPILLGQILNTYTT
jgi:hypothetical protein